MLLAAHQASCDQAQSEADEMVDLSGDVAGRAPAAGSAPVTAGAPAAVDALLGQESTVIPETAQDGLAVATGDREDPQEIDAAGNPAGWTDDLFVRRKSRGGRKDEHRTLPTGSKVASTDSNGDHVITSDGKDWKVLYSVAGQRTPTGVPKRTFVEEDEGTMRGVDINGVPLRRSHRPCSCWAVVGRQPRSVRCTL